GSNPSPSASIFGSFSTLCGIRISAADSRFRLASRGFAYARMSPQLENRYTRKGIGGSNPSPSATIFVVRPAAIGKRTFRRHALHFWPEGIFKGLQSFLLQVYITEIIIHKTDEPDAVVDLFDAVPPCGIGISPFD